MSKVCQICKKIIRANTVVYLNRENREKPTHVGCFVKQELHRDVPNQTKELKQ